MTVRTITVSIVDNDVMLRLARERGYVADRDDGPSILDLVDECEATRCRLGFASVTKAKDWARRHRSEDFWGAPELLVDEYPDARRLCWERETVRHLRLTGDGDGWEDLT